MAPVRHTPRAVARRQRAAQPKSARPKFVDIVRERRKRNAKHSLPAVVAGVAFGAMALGAAMGATPTSGSGVFAAPAEELRCDLVSIRPEAMPWCGMSVIAPPPAGSFPTLVLEPVRSPLRVTEPKVAPVAQAEPLPAEPPRIEVQKVRLPDVRTVVRTEVPRPRPPVVRPTPKPTTPPSSPPTTPPSDPTSEPTPDPSPAPRADRPRLRDIVKSVLPRRDRSSSSSSSEDGDGESSSSSSSSRRSERSSRSSKRDSSGDSGRSSRSRSDSGGSRSASRSNSGSGDSNE